VNNFLEQIRWNINSQVRQLFLFMGALVTILLLSQTALAQERETDLTLRLVSHWYGIEATADEDNSFFLEVNNIGNKAITDIKLSSDKPEDWVINFRPGSIDYLGPGTLQTVGINIKPPRSLGGREHEISFIADANEIRKVEKFRVTVKMAPLWVWIGAGGVLIVITAFILIYMRFGRQTSET